MIYRTVLCIFKEGVCKSNEGDNLKQYNFELENISHLENALDSLHKDIDNDSYSSILFHIYTNGIDKSEIDIVKSEILDAFPTASIGGTSTNGGICDGHLVDEGMVISVSVFESTSTQVKLFNCIPGNEDIVGKSISDFIDSTENIVAAELLITLKSINSHIILNNVEKCHKDIFVFGGGSAAVTISDENTCVIDENDISPNGVLVITYSGPDFHIDVHHAIGWKALGKELKVTKIKGKQLFEINNTPAGKVYSKYLDIQADENFFSNILEFPIMSHQHGNEVLRLPFSCNHEDNSIILAADIDPGTPINLSYGDPDVIKEDVIALIKKVKAFAPQAIFLYSCGVRRLYWKYLINKETAPFAAISPTSGFYSSGEIMRMGDHIIEHHVTLIAIGMREGEKAIAQPSFNGDKALPIPEEQKMHSQVSMVRRLANFINVTAAELQEANEKLQEIADTDELTGLYNRRMLNKLVSNAIDRANKNGFDMIIGIADIDNFKEINDTYGHVMGDKVLVELAKQLDNEVEKLPSGIIGRWGGEEFMFIAPTLKLDDVLSNIEEARKRVSSIIFDGIDSPTVSLGLTAFVMGDTAESVFKRADAALYEAKETGKNKTCVK